MIRAQGGAAILVRGDTSPEDVGGVSMCMCECDRVCMCVCVEWLGGGRGSLWRHIPRGR